ncbi:MAG TPA: TonB family protein [Pyrinomonadaceae bacterium]|jgi:TonB family protein
MAHDAFISYSKKDKAIADAICKALEDDGLSCWYAPRDVEIGADWDASIMGALANSRVMILVWSSNSDSSRQVKRELAIALDDIGVSLIPFRTEIIEPSKLRYYLGNIQWLDASVPPLENNLRLLIEEVRTAIARINHSLESAQGQLRPTEEDKAEIKEVAPVKRASEDSRLQAVEESVRLAKEKRPEEEERQRLEMEQRKADDAERQRADEEARERAAEETRTRAAEETERLAQEKQAAERERQRLAEEQAKADELERQRVEAEVRQRQQAEAQKRDEPEERKREEAEVRHRAEAREREQLAANQRQEPEARKQARVGTLYSLNSSGSTPNQRLPLQRIVISVVVLLIVVAGLAYAFWPAKHDELNQLSTEAVASNQTPSPEILTPLLSPSVENKSGSSPAKPSPTPRKVPTPAKSPIETSDPPPAKPSPTPHRAPISGGVLNGKAISLPKPAYPPIARQAHASGTVSVQVTIDENGNVISAHAVSGHPLLQGVAVAAARGARFTPTRLEGQPVKVTGVITYNFVAQ